MKFIVAFAAILAVASAAPQYLNRGFGTFVEGSKTIIAGPSGTISVDSGSSSEQIAPRLIAPEASQLIGARSFAAPLLPDRLLGACL